MANISSHASAVATPLPPAHQILVAIGIMSAVLMQVLDQTIANVALPHMQAALGATQESIAWVLTSYIVASAIALPATGWLAGRLGTRRLFIGTTIGFTLASIFCGFSTTLPMMVVARALQGIFGAFLIPLSQAVLFNIFPREKQASAMAAWGIGVMVGPILGPLVGGYLTEAFDWRFVFFINLPFGVIALALMTMIPDTPREERKFDMTGFILLGLALSALQLMLDRGAHLDWLDSWEIRIEFGLAICAAWMFAVHTFTAANPLIRRDLFKDRNLMIAMVLSALTSGVTIAGSALLAPMLQRLMGFNAFDAGLVTMPRGIGMIMSMLVAGRLIKYVEGRIMIAFGLSVSCVSLWMMSGFSLGMDSRPVIISGLIQGLGFGFVVLPMNLFALSTLDSRLRTDGASIYSLGRTLGGSIGISICTTMLARNLQISHSDLSVNFTHISLAWLNTSAAQQINEHGLPIIQMLDNEINRQAMMIAYVDDYYMMFWASLVVIPLVAFMRKPKRMGTATEAMSIAD